MGRGVRAVLGDSGELVVGRGVACRVCEVCEGQRKGCVVLEIGRKHLLAAVLAVLNLNLTRDLQVVLSLVLMLVWVLEGCRRRCSGVRAN
jgi:hypothetical protein